MKVEIERKKNRMKWKFDFFNFYIIYWKWIWIVFILVAENLNCYILVKKFPPDNINYFQGIFLGLITFSIPALWILYQDISKVKERSIGYSAENIINRKIYEDLFTCFLIFIFIPFTIFLLLGLVFLKWLSIILIWFDLFLSLSIILSYPKIVVWIEEKTGLSQPNDKKLEKFVKETPLNEELFKAFEDIFLNYTEITLNQKLNISLEKWIEIFTNKMDELLEKIEIYKNKELDRITNIFWDLSSFLEKISIEKILFRQDFFKRFLNWYFIVWNKEKAYSSLIGSFGKVFGFIVKKSLISPVYIFDSFFYVFEEHINQHISEKKYIRHLLFKFCHTFFENYRNLECPEEIWELIPSDWKVTSKNLKEEKAVAKIMLEYFLSWVWRRISVTKEGEYDKELEEISYHLFPETEPIYWASVLIFIFSPYSSEEKRVEEVINRPWTFEPSRRIIEYWGKEGIERASGENYQEQVKETLKLAKMLFGKTFSQENMEKYLKEIETLEKEYKKDKIKYGRLQRLKLVFEGIKSLE